MIHAVCILHSAYMLRERHESINYSLISSVQTDLAVEYINCISAKG